MKNNATTTDAMRNAFSPVQQLTQGTSSPAQEEPKKRGRKPKEPDTTTTRATFILNEELWEKFKAYAEILGKKEDDKQTTVTDLLTEYIKKTVDENQTAIDAYREAKERARMAAKAALPDQKNDL